MQDAYFKRFPNYPRGITVPAIVDVPTGTVVTNDYASMTLDFPPNGASTTSQMPQICIPRTCAQRLMNSMP